MTPIPRLVLTLVAVLSLATHAPAQDAGVGMTKVIVPGPSYLGGLVEFEIIVTNESRQIAANVTIVEDLPAGLSVVDVVPSTGAYDYERDEWVVGDLKPGQAESLTVRTVRWVDASLTNCTFARYLSPDGESVSSSAACATIEPAIVAPGELVTVRTR